MSAAQTPLLCPPPDVATLGERRRADDFGGHPGVGAGGAHLGGAVPLSSQPKVCDLQSLVAEVFHLNPLEDEDWSGRGGIGVMRGVSVGGWGGGGGWRMCGRNTCRLAGGLTVKKVSGNHHRGCNVGREAAAGGGRSATR